MSESGREVVEHVLESSVIPSHSEPDKDQQRETLITPRVEFDHRPQRSHRDNNASITSTDDLLTLGEPHHHDNVRHIGGELYMSSDLTPQRVTPLVSLMTTVLGVLLVFTTAYTLGDQYSFYQLLFGGGVTHLLSQVCTTLLFFWGVGEAMRLLIQIKEERAAVYGAEHTLTQTHLSHKTPLARLFSAEVTRGVDSSKDYVEARDLVTATREGILDQLSAQERGVQAAMWLIPLSGFLGTVLGMSATIARFDELFNPANGGKLLGLTQLAPAIQGLGTAFDTTLLALALVIPLKLLLVLTQSLGERLAHELEFKVAAPLLDQISSTEERSTPSDSSIDTSYIEEQLTRLSAQSNHLNLMIGETAQVLGTLRDQLTQHPVWSPQIQQEWRMGIEQAVHDGVAHASLHALQTDAHSTIETAVHYLTEQQDVIQRQLNDVQVSLEAPLIIQRDMSHNTPQHTPQYTPPQTSPLTSPSESASPHPTSSLSSKETTTPRFPKRSSHRPLKRRS
jgi:hypothetical protein